MIDPFVNRLSSGKQVGEVLIPLLSQHGGDVLIVDVGARNSMEWPAELVKQTRFVGFEPNQEEYDKLVSHTTDAQNLGITVKKFGQEEFHDCAVWGTQTEKPFYITEGTGACTMMGHSNESVASKVWLDVGDAPYSDMYSKVIESHPVKCDTLDNLFSKDNCIDFLKIDVEGAEMEVLKGAAALFSRQGVLFVKSEFFLVPFFENNQLLGHQHTYLHDHGFRMIGMELDKNSYMYGKKSSIPAMADSRLLYGGDAYFMLDPDLNELSEDVLFRMGIVALALGFRSLSVSLFHDSKLLDDRLLVEIEKALHQIPLKKRLKYFWQSLPDRVLKIIRP